MNLSLPSYAIANVRVGVESNNRSMEVFISNLTDENGYLSDITTLEILEELKTDQELSD